jgi:hypothetical protein
MRWSTASAFRFVGESQEKGRGFGRSRPVFPDELGSQETFPMMPNPIPACAKLQHFVCLNSRNKVIV